MSVSRRREEQGEERARILVAMARVCEWPKWISLAGMPTGSRRQSIVEVFFFKALCKMSERAARILSSTLKTPINWAIAYGIIKPVLTPRIRSTRSVRTNFSSRHARLYPSCKRPFGMAQIKHKTKSCALFHVWKNLPSSPATHSRWNLLQHAYSCS